MSNYYGVLLDTVSIQKYIFQSYDLRENLGASFLVEAIYRDYLQEAGQKVFGIALDVDAWKKDASEILSCTKPVEIGYIGGGNALLLFQEEEKARKFIKEWTQFLLLQVPGITTAVALNSLDLTDFKTSKKKLFDVLRENKSRYIPETSLLSHGITSECTHSGLSMEVWNPVVGEYVSASTNAKIDASKWAKDLIQHGYRNILKDEFCFTDQLDQLGQIRHEDSHIAVVHIDGNDVGERFKKMESLKAIRELSKTLDQATRDAFSELLTRIVDNYEKIMEYLGFDNYSKDERHQPPMDGDKKILPIRPIILGGDDLTFVCDGKLGIYFSKVFMEAFERKLVSDKQPLTACAGVAIIKTKYPFYRGYRLAEELCGHAKSVRKRNNDNCSYIDFHISTGNLAGSLDEIREKSFKVPQGYLLYRPYKLVPKNEEQSFDLFVENTGKLKYKPDNTINFPNNKIGKLRQVLTLSKEATQQFVKEEKCRGRGFPDIPGRDYATSLFLNEKTPYFDMIELLEFYPDFELAEQRKQK
jgi:hypothetical protein